MRPSKPDFRAHVNWRSMKCWAALALLVFLSFNGAPSVADWSGETYRWRLDNGMTVLYRYNPVSQTVAMAAFVKVPVTAERADQAGIRHLVQGMLVYRAPEAGSFDPIEQLGHFGAAAATFVDYDSTQVTVAGLAEHFDSYLSPLRDILFGEQFAWEHFNSIRATAASMLEASRENAVGFAMELAHERLFSGAAGSRPLYGTEASLRRLRQADVRKFHAEYWRPNNVVLSISGPMPVEQCHRQVDAAFARTLPGVVREFADAPSSGVPPGYVYRPWATANAAIFVMGLAPTPDHDIYAASQVLAAVIAGGQGSLLWQALRDSEPLAYAVDAMIEASSVAGTLQVVCICDAVEAVRVSEIVASQIDALRATAPSEKQVANAIGYIEGRYLSQQQSNLEAAVAMGRLEAMVPNKGLELHANMLRQIRSVTPVQVQQAAQLCAANAIMVQVGGSPRSL